MCPQQLKHVESAQTVGFAFDAVSEHLSGLRVCGPRYFIDLRQHGIQVLDGRRAVDPLIGWVKVGCPLASGDFLEGVVFVVTDGIVGGHIIERQARQAGVSIEQEALGKGHLLVHCLFTRQVLNLRFQQISAAHQR